jgi:uncharacterized membrane protein
MRDALNRYYKVLKKKLDCPKQSKIRFLGQTQRLVEDFVEGKPDARFEDVYGFLGDPAALAETFLSTLDPEEISRYRRYRHIQKICCFLAPVAVITFLIVLIYCITQMQLDIDITKESILQSYNT